MLKRWDKRLAQEGDMPHIHPPSFLEHDAADQYGCNVRVYGE